MKTIILCMLAAALMLPFGNAHAQIKVDLKKKIEREANKRANQKADKAVKKTFDAAEEGMTEAATGDANEKANKKGDTQKTEESGTNETQPAGHTGQVPPSASEKNQPQTEAKPTLNWAGYDFVPGPDIIFEDNLEGEQNGEFPSKWDLAGGVIENAQFGGENVIMFRKCNINGTEGMVPLLKNSAEDYLPEEFTIEFDAWYEKPMLTYRIYLVDTKNQRNLEPTNNINNRFYLRFDQNAADGRNISKGYYPSFNSNNVAKSQPGWRHIAISFNKRALKAYIDDARVLNIPNLGINPVGVNIGFHNPSGNAKGYIKNIRIAKGAVPLYDKVLTDGKFVTTGIKFDVNKAVIRPESMGTISYVVKMMNDNPGLNFSVEGHTDNDGDEARNQTLSEARAKAIREKMIEMGIDASRLTAKGWGESKTIAPNDTPENKALNRRVEFVKI
jgi:outer membrane protein OmpA-like peptidoglycan-associated protein